MKYICKDIDCFVLYPFLPVRNFVVRVLMGSVGMRDFHTTPPKKQFNDFLFSNATTLKVTYGDSDTRRAKEHQNTRKRARFHYLLFVIY